MTHLPDDPHTMTVLTRWTQAVGAPWWRWPNFTPYELRDRDNETLRFVPAFLDALQALRTEFGDFMPVTSAGRNPEHNARVSSTKALDGPHVRGLATDVGIYNPGKRRLASLATLEAGWTGVGIYPWGIHLDRVPEGDPVIGRPACWGRNR